ncbi:MAG: excinuclease ABC subunit UvrA [Prevotella sp.]|nr:excinuclease ABC subunit UvrA [Prevotella sp.]
MEEEEKICVWGAREHNLKNIDVQMPRQSLTVITGLSGSGKSSLAFDTIFAEGQRRYLETFSAYARNFLGGMQRPDVDKITGLSPVISIEQKTTNKNPRSTVGTQTEVSDFLRLLFARAGKAYSYVTGEPMKRYTEEQVMETIGKQYAGHAIYIMAPLVRSRKGHYRELFEQLRRKGFLNVRVDGVMQELRQGMKVDRYRNHDIEVVVDKMKVQPLPDNCRDDDAAAPAASDRLKNTVALAMKMGEGLVLIMDRDTGDTKFYSRRLMCPTSGIAYNDPAPNNFSFNSPQGACPRCKGLGMVSEMDLDKVIPDRRKSVAEGGIAPLGKAKQQMIFWQIEAVLSRYDCTLKTPLADVPDEALQEVMYGTIDDVRIDHELVHTTTDYYVSFAGVAKYLRDMMERDDSAAAQKWADQFLADKVCPECGGNRLNREAMSYRLGDKNIAELSNMDIRQLRQWLDKVDTQLEPQQLLIAREIMKEIRTRLDFLLEVGLDYLALSRASASLSGGESQRIRLATQIGSQLVNVLYILDEPSIGLHQRDNQRLIDSLKELRDIGNSVVVVEHDRDMMMAADYIIDIGPRAGRKGGEVVFQGTPQDMLRKDTLTARYLNGTMSVASSVSGDATGVKQSMTRRIGSGHSIVIRGARGNNLKNVDVEFPLGKLIVVTGVSGSGKSTLINETLQPILSQHFYRSLQQPMPYDSIEGLENVDKVVSVDQSPIGRTPRSNPATYTGVFGDIRSLFVALPEAKIRGYKPGRFSFNVKGGRCESCGGNGYKSIEMNFLPDVMVPCEECRGKRYNRETLEVRYKGKSIADVLDMTINQAVEFFENVPDILRKIKTLQQVGLGYIKLGQPSNTLSGGECQRVKLATELAKKDTGRTLYILDEPTTGLHFDDIRILMDVLGRLVDKGNTVIVIEHNLDVICLADHIIDMGPEGGRGGGNVLSVGTPEQVAMSKLGYTPHFIHDELERMNAPHINSDKG